MPQVRKDLEALDTWELRTFAADVLWVLYGQPHDDGLWLDPDKEWDSDTFEALAQVIEKWGLAPETAQGWYDGVPTNEPPKHRLAITD